MFFDTILFGTRVYLASIRLRAAALPYIASSIRTMAALAVLPREVLAKCLEFLTFDQAVEAKQVSMQRISSRAS